MRRIVLVGERELDQASEWLRTLPVGVSPLSRVGRNPAQWCDLTCVFTECIGRCTLPHPTKDVDEPPPPLATLLGSPPRWRAGSRITRRPAPAATRRPCRRIVARYARTLSERDWGAARRAVLGGRDLLGTDAPDRGNDSHQAVPIDLALGVHRPPRSRGCDPPRFDIRILRADYRQDGDLAAVWLTTPPASCPSAGSVDRTANGSSTSCSGGSTASGAS